MRRTPKLEALLELIAAGAGAGGIYALARAARRPYRRVHDQVQRLAAEGLVRLELVRTGSRVAARVLPVNSKPPKLKFDRAWSRPRGGIDAETAIAQVLARPTFTDLLACVRQYGLDRVQRVYDELLRRMELAPGAAAASGRMLTNIEVGSARAAGFH